MGFPRQEYWSRVAISSSRGSSRCKDQTHMSCIGRQILYHWATREAPRLFLWVSIIMPFSLGKNHIKKPSVLIFSHWLKKYPPFYSVSLTFYSLQPRKLNLISFNSLFLKHLFGSLTFENWSITITLNTSLRLPSFFPFNTASSRTLISLCLSF